MEWEQLWVLIDAWQLHRLDGAAWRELGVPLGMVMSIHRVLDETHPAAPASCDLTALAQSLDTPQSAQAIHPSNAIQAVAWGGPPTGMDLSVTPLIVEEKPVQRRRPRETRNTESEERKKQRMQCGMGCSFNGMTVFCTKLLLRATIRDHQKRCITMKGDRDRHMDDSGWEFFIEDLAGGGKVPFCARSRGQSKTVCGSCCAQC